MKCIIVKDYLNMGRNEFGIFYCHEDGVDKFLLDDCDVYTLKQLREEEGYGVIEFNSDEIVKWKLKPKQKVKK